VCTLAKSIKRSEKERQKVVFIECYPKNKFRCPVATVMKITPAMPSDIAFGNLIWLRLLAFKRGCVTRFSLFVLSSEGHTVRGSLIHTANSFRKYVDPNFSQPAEF
jgi:hypothetical protein